MRWVFSALLENIWEQIIDGIVMKALWTARSSSSHFQYFSSFSSESDSFGQTVSNDESRETVNYVFKRLLWFLQRTVSCQTQQTESIWHKLHSHSLTHFNSTPTLTYGFTHAVPLSSLKSKLACIFTSIKNFYAVDCRKQYSTHYSTHV